jgi:hypothetical protein
MEEYVIGFAFVGLFFMLLLSMTYIYILSTKLTNLASRLEKIEKVVNMSTDNAHVLIERLKEIKETIEGRRDLK